MSPFTCLGLIVAYLVVIAGLVQWMKNREKFQLKTFSLLHNIFLTALSAYMAFFVALEAIKRGYSLFGNSLDRTPTGNRMAELIWLFYVSKIAEFGDTVIMALKKNNHQISFLHVYHHTSIFFIWWIICYFAPGGESYFSAALNSFIHVLMYGYYLWSSLAGKPKDEKRPRPTEPAYYKRYITNMQMLQFTVMFIQAVSDLFIAPPKDYPKFAAWILFYYMMTMLGLFANFYIGAYLRGGKKRQAAAEAAATGKKDGKAE